MTQFFGKATRVAVLSVTLAAGSASLAWAQPGGTGGGTADTGRTYDNRADRGFDYGWLGLLGLAGLVGLMRRNGTVHRHDAGSVGGSTGRH
jgi:hypothetical protein